MTNFVPLIGKTIVAIAVTDEGRELVLMFNDGTAQALDMTVTETLTNGQSGLRSITGVTAILNHPITAARELNSADPDVTTDEYFNYNYFSAELVTSSGNLVINYLRDSGSLDRALQETTPIGFDLLTGDYTAPTPYADLWN